MKIRTLRAGSAICVLSLLLSGCVSTQKYNDLLLEKEAFSLDRDKLATQNEDLKAQLAGLLSERDALSGQVLKLKTLQENLTAAESKILSLQRLTQQKDKQLEAVDILVKELTTKVNTLQKENDTLKGKPAEEPAEAPGAE
jgi:outer membrane murein-binding lipoprotein Lpp